MRPALRLLREATECRSEVARERPLLTHHLGAFDRGPMTDSVCAAGALAAVAELRQALGDRSDSGRIEALLLADAFAASEVAAPARILQMVLDAWSADSLKAGSTGALEMSLADLVAWLEDASIAADLLEEAASAVAEAGPVARSVRGLVDHLLARERISESDTRLDRAAAIARRSS
jgi:hypothetical protein